MSNKLAGKCHRDDSCAVDIGDDREIDHRHGKSGEHWDVLQLVGDPKNSAPWVAPRRDMAALSAVLADIGRAGGCACQVTGDATKFSDIEAMRRQIEREFGPIDILVANAGGSFTKPGPMEETTEEGWRASIDGNLTATFLTIKSVLPGMKERRAGNIITISSAAARKPYHAAPIPYAAAKAGIQILTQDLAAQVGQCGIRANCIAPETILTERNRQLIPAVQQKALESHPVRRLGTPEDVTSAALYLASDEAAWIAGIILDVRVEPSWCERGAAASGAAAQESTAVKELIPTGKLRVGVVFAPAPSAFFVVKEANGEPRGVTVDLAVELGRKLGVPVEFMVASNSGLVTDATESGAIDVAFMPVDEERKKRVDFGPAYFIIESTYLVTGASGIKTVAEVDRPDVRVVGIANTTTIRAAGRSLKNTSISAATSVDEAMAMLRSGKADAFALSRDSLRPFVAQLPDSRIVDGSFQQTGIAIAIPKNRPNALAYVTAFMESAKASGSVRRALDRAGFRNDPVAP